ncbi:MAG: hypothetical protein H0X46_09440, partial [Bacteroidetes bacterium]|nr:hypothetical protein [Bacteroidota bacterium]
VTDNNILWNSDLDSTNCVASYAPMGYFMNCDSLNWGNADQFYSAPSYTTISMNLSGTFDPSQITAYVWYDNVNGIWSCWGGFNSATNLYLDEHVASNVAAHLIVVSVKNGKLYTAILGTTITDNATYNLTLTETSETSFSNSLNTLP